MNPNQPPQPPIPTQEKQRELTDEALNKKFSISFTRNEIFALRGPILKHWREFGLGDVKVFLGILEKTEDACVLIEKDYKAEEKAATKDIEITPTKPIDKPVN